MKMSFKRSILRPKKPPYPTPFSTDFYCKLICATTIFERNGHPTIMP